MDQIKAIAKALRATSTLCAKPYEEVARELFDRGLRVLPVEVCVERLTASDEESAWYLHCIDCRERDYGGCSDCGFIDVTVCRRLAAFEKMVYNEAVGDE